jgi:hypothetical protein
MEKNVFTAPAVAEVLEGMIEARLHTDNGDAQSAYNKELQLELTNSVATPIYVIQDPVSDVSLIGQMKASYLQDPDSFAAMLEKARTKLALSAVEAREKVARSSD